ncbi:rRNA-binding ribosome biosynthesis protein utp25 [Mucor circinelloides]
MAKERSAISKSMSKKRVSGTHVSGLSSSKTASKRKEAPVKYGKLSRKQKQDLEDYGELVPKDFEEDEADSTKRRRVVSEADLDREMDEERRRAEGQYEDSDELDDADSDDEEEEEDWKKPSAYSLLMGSLKKNSKQKDFYKKIQREQEGIEDVIESADEELVDEEEVDEEEMDDVSGDEEEQDDDLDEDEEQDDDLDEGEEQDVEDDEPVDGDAADPLEEDEEEEIVYVGSDVEEDDASDDLFESRFADQQPTSFDEKISVIEQKKWVSQAFEDEVLKDVTALTTVADNTVKDMPKIESLDQVQVKQRIAKCWPKANKQVIKKTITFTPLQDHLFHQMNNYRDMVFCNRSLSNAKEIRNAYALHALNHITKTRDRVLKNNAKLSKAQKEGTDAGEMRDQGFTRPKVLIILPFRNTVVDLVDTFIKLSGTEQHENKNRFLEQFNLREEEAVDTSKPADYLQNFQGNIDDHFRLGIKFAKKSMKIYSDFYNADVIIASPLGLRTLIGSEGDKKRDFDFLSSIELVILDQTNHFLMQNWEHIDHIFQHLNLIPTDGHGCDISRIKSWYLDGKAKYLRQTLVFADFLTPEFNALFNKHMKNVAGKLKIKRTYEEGSILDVIPQVQQSFTRIDAPSLKAINDVRYKYFIEKTLPTLRKSAIMQSHTLIFIPSYFDFVRVRNYFEDNKYSYEPCSEYASGPAITRSRAQFFHGRSNFMLYTERLHFFRRYNIRGTFHVVFYGLPEDPLYYTEIVNFLGLKFDEASAAEEATFSCTALFSKYDFLKLERVVGTERAKKMCTAQKNVFMFA